MDDDDLLLLDDDDLQEAMENLYSDLDLQENIDPNTPKPPAAIRKVGEKSKSMTKFLMQGLKKQKLHEESTPGEIK